MRRRLGLALQAIKNPDGLLTTVLPGCEPPAVLPPPCLLLLHSCRCQVLMLRRLHGSCCTGCCCTGCCCTGCCCTGYVSHSIPLLCRLPSHGRTASRLSSRHVHPACPDPCCGPLYHSASRLHLTPWPQHCCTRSARAGPTPLRRSGPQPGSAGRSGWRGWAGAGRQQGRTWRAGSGRAGSERGWAGSRGRRRRRCVRRAAGPRGPAGIMQTGGQPASCRRGASWHHADGGPAGIMQTGHVQAS